MSDSEPSPSTVVLLVAHGSRNPRAAREHEQLCDRVEAQLRTDGEPAVVRPAYLEITPPSIPDAIANAVRDGARTVRVIPHFLNAGNHVLVDLPTTVERTRAEHPGTTIELAAHLGADPGLVELLARTARG